MFGFGLTRDHSQKMGPFEFFSTHKVPKFMLAYTRSQPLRIRHRGLPYEADMENGKLPIPSHQIVGFSLLGVILVSPLVERSFLNFLLVTWVLQTLVILTFNTTKRG